MYEELISKKDLLIETKISYGQLYRWKRKDLIPEEWFIKKSVSTGQETFFPRERILERINVILELKDEVSLDELASKLANKISISEIKKEYLISRNIASEIVINKYEEFMGVSEKYNDQMIFSLILYNDLINSGLVSNDEVKEIIINAKEDYNNIIQGEYYLIIKRKLGVLFHYVTKEKNELIKDNEAKVVYKILLSDIMKKFN